LKNHTGNLKDHNGNLKDHNGNSNPYHNYPWGYTIHPTPKALYLLYPLIKQKSLFAAADTPTNEEAAEKYWTKQFSNSMIKITSDPFVLALKWESADGKPDPAPAWYVHARTQALIKFDQ
jgi:hypothetical protein